MNQEKLEELQAETYELDTPAQDLLAAIRNAHGCETAEDFIANIDEALSHVAGIVKDLELIKRLIKLK